MVSVVLDNLAAGIAAEEIVDQYHVTPEAIRGCLSYASELSKDPVLWYPTSHAG